MRLIEIDELIKFFFVRCRFAEVGKLTIPKIHEKYETGQFFLHRVFGYRGVILFPWRAKVYDRNAYVANYLSPNAKPATANDPPTMNASDTATTTKDETEATNTGTKQTAQEKLDRTEAHSYKKEVAVDVQTYYQVLIDSRDCPHVVI